MAVKKAKTQKREETPDFCAYIGPTIRGVVPSGTLFPYTRAELLEKMSGVCADYPELRHLVIEGKRLAQARKEIQRTGTLLHTKYAALLARLNKGGTK